MYRFVRSVLITLPQPFVLILDAGQRDCTRKRPTVISFTLWKMEIVSMMVTTNKIETRLLI